MNWQEIYREGDKLLNSWDKQQQKREWGKKFPFNKNKKHKCSNDPYLPYLQDFFTTIFLTQSTIMNIWVVSCHFTTESLHMF